MGIGKVFSEIAGAVGDFRRGMDRGVNRRAVEDVFGPDQDVDKMMPEPGRAERAGMFVGENPYKTGIGASLGGLLGLSAFQSAKTSEIVDAKESALGRPMTQSEAYEAFVEAGMDSRMAREMASIYVRERGGTR